MKCKTNGHKSCMIVGFFSVFFCVAFSSLQYLLPAIVHINHQPYLERGDGPIVSAVFIHSCLTQSKYLSDWHTICKTLLILCLVYTVSGARSNQRARSAGPTGCVRLWQVFPHQEHLCLWWSPQRPTD